MTPVEYLLHEITGQTLVRQNPATAVRRVSLTKTLTVQRRTEESPELYDLKRLRMRRIPERSPALREFSDWGVVCSCHFNRSGRNQLQPRLLEGSSNDTA
jgi:hypothetical protein